MKDEWYVWRLVFDERTRIPLHEIWTNYRMEDLEGIHQMLDALDDDRRRRDKQAEADAKKKA